MSIEPTDAVVKGLSEKILRYFREFLSTDFKRQAAPRRRIQLKTQAGYRCAIDLRKYPAFFKDAWGLTAKPAQDMKLALGHRKYKAQISPVLKNLIEQFLNQLPEQGCKDVRDGVVRQAQAERILGGENPEAFAEQTVSKFAEMTAAQVVHPLLVLLEGPFKQAAYSVEESIFEVESDLTDALCAAASEHIPAATNTLLLSGDTEPLTRALGEFFTLTAVKDQMLSFFESFAAADAYQEVRDVLNFMRSEDSLTTYLYFGAIKIGANDFPLFYLPVTCTQEAEGSGYLVTADPRLFIHKQAVEFVVAELQREAERVGVAVIPERIVHLTEGDTAIKRMVSTLSDLTRTLDLAGDIQWTEFRPQLARSPQLRLSNAAYLAVFDRSDESLVNDYEALLSSLEEDHQAAAGLFQGMVRALLFEDPVSVSAAVRADWQAMSASERLIPLSPIPLNEEQIRIENARRQPGCRFIAVEGPPGTGKSHSITALTFNAIMEHRSVLVISDKTEALDVVQDKLEQALKSVRHGDDFPNPILRIGTDGTYRSLMSGASRGRIQGHHQAQSANMPGVERELAVETKRLAEKIDQTVNALTHVDMNDLARFHALEAKVDAHEAGLSAVLSNRMMGFAAVRLKKAHAAFQAAPRPRRTEAEEPASLAALMHGLRLVVAAERVEVALRMQGTTGLSLFDRPEASKATVLLGLIAKVEALRRPIVGFFLRGPRLAQMDLEIAQQLPCPNPVGVARQIDALKCVAVALNLIAQQVQRLSLSDADSKLIYGLLCAPEKQSSASDLGFEFMSALEGVIGDLACWTAPLAVSGVARDGREAPNDRSAWGRATLLADHLTLSDRLYRQFASVPMVDFVKEKRRLETLHTARLAHQLDSRFLAFVENHRATAQALGGVIKQRAQFPTEQFKTLREAFPCVLAGIRELGEFVPLKTAVFDILIIDEGSQMSVAQAMPAMLRAKQVVVFGDHRQFSNVKSHNASNAMNAGYLSDLQDHLRAHIGTAADKLERLQRFDVKRSVLELVGMLAGHTEMLRKHFRGYPELISFSNQHFYGGQLQAIKVRAVPIDEVVQFEVIEHDGRTEAKTNTNSMEAARIIDMLDELLKADRPFSVGIITPHREQAAMIGALIMRHPDGDRFESTLRLKVMTFDTCQGEERDMIIYSMVATRQRDVLNYVFPVDLKINEDAEEGMKAQRLNVGFSRAREAMVFVLSKPPEEFKGSIGRALMHYQRVLNDRSVAQDQDIDPASPMERRVLGWIKATPFMQTEAEHVELIAQFPVGEYLRQLDPTYAHPAYRVDFLLRHFGNDTISNVIIEYDGFAEHFTQPDRVTAANHERYYKSEDVERQFVLESYGYRFLRVNRFNLGDDPVDTLNRRILAMISPVSHADEPSAVGQIKSQAKALGDGESKVCGKCKTIRPLVDFFDPSLAGGLGGSGRLCMPCKAPVRPTTARHGFHQSEPRGPRPSA